MRKNDLFPDSFSEVKTIANPTWKHRLYYDFLRISPSYFLIHQYKNKKVGLAKIKKVEQYEKVIEQYKLFGDVFNISFDNWWDKKGYKLFEPNQNSHVLFKINLKKSLSVNLDLLKAIYQSNKEKIKFYDPVLVFEKNKMQELVLLNRLRLIELFIDPTFLLFNNKDNDGSKNPSWFFAYKNKDRIFGRMTGESYKKIKLAITFIESTMGYIPEKLKKSEDENLKYCLERPYMAPISIKNTSNKAANRAKRYLSMLVSKNKREALVIAENAARGFFPTKKLILNKYPDFNFDELRSSPEFNRSLEDILDQFDKLPYVTGSNSKTKRNLYLDRWFDVEMEHRLLEGINGDLKKVINEKAEEIYRQKLKKIIDEDKNLSKSIPRHSVFVRR